MKLLYVIYTHNRAKVLEQCLSSLFNKNITKPDRVLIIDDGSNLDVKNKKFVCFKWRGFKLSVYLHRQQQQQQKIERY